MRRAVDFVDQTTHIKTGGEVTFLLVKVPRNGTVPIPIIDTNINEAEYRSLSLPFVNSHRAKFSRMCVETLENVCVAYKQECTEIQEQLKECEAFGDEVGKRLLARVTDDVAENYNRWIEQGSVIVASAVAPIISDKRIDAVEKDLFFYQLNNSKLAFLDPFNMRLLSAEFGNDMAAFPSSLSAHVVAVNEVVLTPQSSKRFPFLSRFPLFSNILFVELDLESSGVLSKHVVDTFRKELQQRARERKAQKKKEQRHERKLKRQIQDSTNAQIHTYGLDYKEWFERRRLQDTETRIQLKDAFDICLNGEVVIKDSKEDTSLEESNQVAVDTRWGRDEATSRSYSAIVSNEQHFPMLSVSTTKPLAMIDTAVSPITTWRKVPTSSSPLEMAQPVSTVPDELLVSKKSVATTKGKKEIFMATSVRRKKT